MPKERDDSLSFLPDEKQVTERLQKLVREKTTDGKYTGYRWSPSMYTSEAVYRKEAQVLSRDVPLCLGSVLELEDNPQAFLLREAWGQSWIIRRSKKQGYVALANRCRHRGMKLVTEDRGRSPKIVCPYHGWSYDDDGACAFIPEGDKAFPGVRPGEIELERRAVVERGGLLWMLPERGGAEDPAPDLGPHLEAWGLGDYVLKVSESRLVNANWKLLHEAFLEAYHVPFLHRKSLAPATVHHTWINDYFGPHCRGVYPLKRFQEDPALAKAPLRRYVSIVYALFPNVLISFQPFHVLVNRFAPEAPGRTRAYVSLLARRTDAEATPHLVDRDIEFVQAGLLEDFQATEAMQAALEGARQDLVAGAYEAQIEFFHQQLRALNAI